MKLSDMRKEFTSDFAKLVLFSNKQPGHEVAFNEVKRTVDQQLLYYIGLTIELIRGKIPVFKETKKASKTKQSSHIDGLAGDLILYVNKIYQRNTSSYAKLGEYWESLHPNNRWGGRYQDGNHFERLRKAR